MLAQELSCTVIGLEGIVEVKVEVEVEVDANYGLPSIVIVGLPDSPVQEIRKQVQSAIKNSGLQFPCRQVSAHLAPASNPKGSLAYDLSIASGVVVDCRKITQGAF
jgi:magnesium chelatase family protein